MIRIFLVILNNKLLFISKLKLVLGIGRRLVLQTRPSDSARLVVVGPLAQRFHSVHCKHSKFVIWGSWEDSIALFPLLKFRLKWSQKILKV